ncbi:MAG: sensor histidine kinase, partial [Chloroflexi bacterium]
MDIITVYFLYGLSFFSMGLAVMLEVDRSSKLDFARALMPLAGFGLIHGSHEWAEMFLILHPDFQNNPLYDIVGPVRVLLLAISFFFLLSFGIKLIVGSSRSLLHRQMMFTIGVIWLVGLGWVFATHPYAIALVAADVYTRYALAIPGAALSAWGLVLQQRKFFQAGMKGFGRDVVIAAVAFGLYGGVGQLFAPPSPIFPSNYLNSQFFMDCFGCPIQLFRSVMACIAAVAIISSLRLFEQETRNQIESLREAQLEERSRLEELRAELLRRTVRAQESERQRIAREVHDEIGQLLTAIGLGLRAISGSASTSPGRVKEQASQLQGLVSSGFSGLQNLIIGLHPPQLDDFGLMAALRWYSGEVQERYGLSVEFSAEGEEKDLPTEVRVVLFRIIQEGLTNIIRHARVNQAKVQVFYTGQGVSVRILDKGHGFDVDTTLHEPGHPCWGLLGIFERAALVGGECQISSRPGQGTIIEVTVPL